MRKLVAFELSDEVHKMIFEAQSETNFAAQHSSPEQRVQKLVLQDINHITYQGTIKTVVWLK